ncbi:hypothetical protein [Aeromonas hydrophila]|uniref:hypothetical protein n=1 Tax=Aeromonas hydrophila TaxID=644 RepID=UPI003EC59743
MMRTIRVTVGTEWIDLKNEIKYQSGEIIANNNQASSNILFVESDIKPKADERGVIMTGYSHPRSQFNMPANTGTVWCRSEDELEMELLVQTQ